ncbi:hypothetical protein [Candidatus Williamhamiltonella defendens]|uniref:hypothetical protein n=1 Tax=Candidatus Williamhamiltonella defendens TaxID=138072 RepID=UPI001F285421|nr:hypothetical protein [Candidatus Hamiltonella defensa]
MENSDSTHRSDDGVFYDRFICRWGVYLLLIGGSFGQVTLTTLIEAGAFSLTDRQKIFLPWAWCVTVALTFLPLGLTLFALLLGKTPKKSLHGDARFASKKELNAFKYKGNYQ